MQSREEPSCAVAARIRPGFLCRVSGLPTEEIRRLSTGDLSAAAARYVRQVAVVEAERERVEACLYRVIAVTSDRRKRAAVLGLRRAVHNGRPLGKHARTAALLPPHAQEALRELRAEQQRAQSYSDEFARVHGVESSESRRRLTLALQDEDFRKGLLASSAGLAAKLRDYEAFAVEGQLSKRLEKVERALLRYLTRTAMKATPFGRFCSVIPGRIIAGGSHIHFTANPAVKDGAVRLNKALYGILWSHLRTRRGVRARLDVRLNPTVRSVGAGAYVVFFARAGEDEVIQRMRGRPVLDLVQRVLSGGTCVPFADLTIRLAREVGLSTSADEVSRVLDRLIEVGFLQFRSWVRDQDMDWDTHLVAALDGVADEHASIACGLLRDLRILLQRYRAGGYLQREAALRCIKDRIHRASSELALPALQKPLPIYEDATAAAALEIPAACIGRCASDVAELASALLWVSPERQHKAELRSFIESHWVLQDARVPLLTFFEEYCRARPEEQLCLVKEDAETADHFGAGNSLDGFVRHLRRSRARIVEMVRQRCAAQPNAAELVISSAEVVGAIGNLPGSPPGAASFHLFANLLQDSDGTWALFVGPSWGAGFGKMFSRFLYLFPEELSTQILEENEGMSGGVLAEIQGDADFNPNLHPPLVRSQIAYPTLEFAEGQQTISVTDLLVVPDPDDPHGVALVERVTGRKVLPVDLGFLTIDRRPPLFQLLARLGPNAEVSLPLPDWPDASSRAHARSQPVGRTRQVNGRATHPELVHVPRIRFGSSLVLARERWVCTGAVYPSRRGGESAAEYFLRIAAWRSEHGIPGEVYVRILSSTPPAAGSAGEGVHFCGRRAQSHSKAALMRASAASQIGKTGSGTPLEKTSALGLVRRDGDRRSPTRARVSSSRDVAKPQYIDFSNPLLVALFGSLGAGMEHFHAVIEERYPAQHQLLRFADSSFSTELVLQVDVRPSNVPGTGSE